MTTFKYQTGKWRELIIVNAMEFVPEWKVLRAGATVVLADQIMEHLTTPDARGRWSIPNVLRQLWVDRPRLPYPRSLWEWRVGTKSQAMLIWEQRCGTEIGLDWDHVAQVAFFGMADQGIESEIYRTTFDAYWSIEDPGPIHFTFRSDAALQDVYEHQQEFCEDWVPFAELIRAACALHHVGGIRPVKLTPPRQMRRLMARIQDYGPPPLIEYATLAFRIPARPSDRDPTGRLRALLGTRRHTVRGHYKDFGRGAGAFGNPNLREVFFSPEHERGMQRLGAIAKRYAPRVEHDDEAPDA